MSQFFVETPEGDAVVSVDTSLYSRSALQRTAYRFTERCHVFLGRSSLREGKLEVTLSPKDRGTNLKRLVGDFFNELLDQGIRETIRAESGQLRELIVAQAFAEGNLLEECDVATDDEDDPNIILPDG